MNQARAARASSAATKPGAAARHAAREILSSVLDRRQPLDATSGGDNALSVRDRALVRAMVGKTLRHLGEIDAVLDGLMKKRPDNPLLIRTLQLAAAQILFMETADHAAVSLAVETVGLDRRTKRLKGLANAVLRRIARDRHTLLDGIDPGRANTPDWLWQRWMKTYGSETAANIAAANMVEPYLDLSVKRDPESVAEALGGVVLPNGGVRLVPSGPVDSLPGYEAGDWWVQDAAATLPVRLLGDINGKRVADLCAAPGGKTAQLAAAGAHVTAVDISAQRLERLETNLSRLSLSTDVVAADILTWRPDEPLDAVLLDAPCSATGTIRRHPDVARLKRPTDIASLSALQKQMIDRAATMLKPGGVLVYCTCSIEPEEGEHHLRDVAQRIGLTLTPVTADEVPGLPEVVTDEGCVRSLPSHAKMSTERLSGLDGFFVMRLLKPQESF